MRMQWGEKLRWWWASPVARALLALLLMILIGCVFSADGAFFRWSVHRDMLRQVSVYGILESRMSALAWRKVCPRARNRTTNTAFLPSLCSAPGPPSVE